MDEEAGRGGEELARARAGVEVESTITINRKFSAESAARESRAKTKADPNQVKLMEEESLDILRNVQTPADFASAYPKLPLECRALAEEYIVKPEDVLKFDKIGEGVVGTIYRARWRGLPVAIKELKKGFAKGSLAHQDFLKDLHIWAHLRHPNIATFLGLVMEPQRASILCELMDGGSIESIFIEKRKERDGRDWLPPRRVQHSWCVSLARGLCYLHEADPPIVHRDMKPANVLVSADLRVLKITDFGLARTRPSGAYNMTGCTGTKRYMAPEVFQKKPDYGPEVDIYSAALIMYQILVGRRPLESLQPQDVATRAAPPENLRPTLTGLNWLCMKDLLMQMWEGRPEQRPSAREVVEMLERIQRKPGKPKEVACTLFGLECVLSCVRSGLAK